jgi:metal-responsive CopG/Arc/MetJ family transcriptional regulator
MKVKTSLSLSEDLVETLDRLADPQTSRSAFIEKILRDFVDGKERARREAREVAQINRHAAKLNKEMNDALSFQADFAEE